MTVPGARVVLADTQTLCRAALAVALDTAGFRVVAQTSDGDGALRAVAAHVPDLIIVDAELPRRRGAQVCAQVKDDFGSTVRVAVLSDTAREEVLLAAVEAGADGYLTRDMDLDGLLRALRRIGRGEAVVPPLMLGSLLRNLINRRREADAALLRFSRLSRREREVLELLVEGADQESMSEILSISPQTARTHIQNVLSKLEVHSRLEAVALAVEHDFVARVPAQRG